MPDDVAASAGIFNPGGGGRSAPGSLQSGNLKTANIASAAKPLRTMMRAGSPRDLVLRLAHHSRPGGRQRNEGVADGGGLLDQFLVVASFQRSMLWGVGHGCTSSTALRLR